MKVRPMVPASSAGRAPSADAASAGPPSAGAASADGGAPSSTPASERAVEELELPIAITGTANRKATDDEAIRRGYRVSGRDGGLRRQRTSYRLLNGFSIGSRRTDENPTSRASSSSF